MRIEMIYEGTKSERFSRVREALEDLGHEVKDLDLLAAGSFLSDLTNGGIGALYDATDGRGDGSKALARLSESLRIPLLRDGYCYQYLGYLLNRGSVGDAIFRRGYGTGH